MAGAQEAGLSAERDVDCRGRIKSELCKVQYRLVLVGSQESDEMVEDLGDAERGEEHLLIGFHELLHLVSSWLIAK